MQLDSTGRNYSKICGDARMPLFPREMQGFRYRLPTYGADNGRAYMAGLWQPCGGVTMYRWSQPKFRRHNREWLPGRVFFSRSFSSSGRRIRSISLISTPSYLLVHF